MTQNVVTISLPHSRTAPTSTNDTTDDSNTADECRKASGHRLSDELGVEVVCGPVDLAKYVDLSGAQGIIPLTSSKLLKIKSKSFLLRFKTKSSRAEKNATAVDKPVQV